MPFVSRFDILRRAKAHQENRDLPLRIISEETGLAINTLQRVRKNQMERVYLSTMETLCIYFDARRIDDLIELRIEPILPQASQPVEVDALSAPVVNPSKLDVTAA